MAGHFLFFKMGALESLSILDPTYIIYTLRGRKALKPTVDVCYEKTKKNATAEAKQTVTVSLTADIWTSINMDACFAITVY